MNPSQKSAAINNDGAASTRAGEQFAQSMNVLNWFRAHPTGTFMQASEQLGIPVAQIKHELTQLSMCGLPGYFPGSLVEVSLDKTSAQVRFSAGLDRPLALTPMEAGVLLFNLEALRSTLPADQQAPVRSASDKIRALLATARDRSSLDEKLDDAGLASEKETQLTALPEQEETANDLLQQINKAVRERQLVAADYRSLSSDSTTPRTINPDHLAIVSGQAYLWGREEGREQRTYALERMDNVQVGEPGSAPGAAQAPQLKEYDPFQFENAEYWSTLRLSPELVWMLEYYPMWLVEDKETPLVTIPDTGAWLERFCIAYGQHISVVDPEGLQDRVRHRAQRGLRAYNK